MPNDLRLRKTPDITKLENIRKIWKHHKMVAQSPVSTLRSPPPPQKKMEIFVNTSKKPLKYKKQAFPVLRYFPWKLEFIPNNSIIHWNIVLKMQSNYSTKHYLNQRSITPCVASTIHYKEQNSVIVLQKQPPDVFCQNRCS